MLCVASAAEAQQSLTAEEQREFLRTARIVSSRPIGKGVTGSMRLTLSNGKITHDAAFQSVDDRTSDEARRRGVRRAGELNFVDSYKYNIAAYEIARLLGLDGMMPVTVQRAWSGKLGSLTWWVDDVLMDEAEREKTDAQPSSPIAFQRQRMKMRLFAELVGDIDRNKGNILYTTDWGVVMIDFTRAFRLHRSLREPHTLMTIDRALWQRLQHVSRDELRQATRGVLTLEELAAVTARQAELVTHYTQLIRERGEGSVLY